MRIGNVDIKTNVALGPMAGVTAVSYTHLTLPTTSRV